MMEEFKGTGLLSVKVLKLRKYVFKLCECLIKNFLVNFVHHEVFAVLMNKKR